MQAQVPAATLDSQEAFTGVTIKGGDLETGGNATDQPLAATCHDRIAVLVVLPHASPKCALAVGLGALHC